MRHEKLLCLVKWLNKSLTFLFSFSSSLRTFTLIIIFNNEKGRIIENYLLKIVVHLKHSFLADDDEWEEIG